MSAHPTIYTSLGLQLLLGKYLWNEQVPYVTSCGKCGLCSGHPYPHNLAGWAGVRPAGGVRTAEASSVFSAVA